MRLPKFGFNSLQRLGTTAEVTLSEIAKVDGDVVDMQTLEKANMVQGAMKRAKVILSGSIDCPLTLKGIKATKGASGIEAGAGGKIEE